ncbi:MAG: DUF192 domain-containing protein [Dehalococcoidia bacterium]
MRILNTTRETQVADRAVPANNPWKRLVGLLNRSHLDPGEGLVLMPGGGIHMFFMRMAIDVIFVDRDGVVLKTAVDVKPWRVVLAPRHSRYTIELPVGAIEQSATVPGDVLELDIS